MRCLVSLELAATFLRQPGCRTDVHPSRPLALRPGLTTGLPLSRTKRPGRPFAPLVSDRNCDETRDPQPATLYHGPKAVFPSGNLSITLGSLKPYVSFAACQIADFNFFQGFLAGKDVTGSASTENRLSNGRPAKSSIVDSEMERCRSRLHWRTPSHVGLPVNSTIQSGWP